MTLFRPCIDLHDGKVKQIVGGSLRDADNSAEENFVSDRSAADFAAKYREETSGADYSGSVLMRAGLNLTSARKGGWTDGSSVVLHFTKQE